MKKINQDEVEITNGVTEGYLQIFLIMLFIIITTAIAYVKKNNAFQI